MAGSGFLGMFDQGSPWPGRIGLFGAGLQDAGSYLQNQPDAATHLKSYQAQQEAAQARQELAAAFATGDTAKIRTALQAFVAAGGDPSGAIAAQQYGRPEIKSLGDNPASIDPITGRATPLPGFAPQIKPKPTVDVRVSDDGKWAQKMMWNPATGQYDQPIGRKWLTGPGDQAKPVTRVPHPSSGWK
jgi:hypothetical protein